MAITVDSPFGIIRTLIKKFLGEMRLIRTNAEEQVKARAEEIKSTTLVPGKSQYTVADVDAIIRAFKDNYVRLLRDIHLMIVTESTTKIRQGIEYGFTNSNIIKQELMDELNRYKTEAQKVPKLQEQIKKYELKIDELNDAVGELKAENITLQNQIADLKNLLQSKDQQIEKLAKRAPTYAVDESVIKERDRVIAEKDKMIHQLSLEKTNIQSEYNRLKIEYEALQKRTEELEARLRTVRSEAVSKEDQLFEELQKQLDKSRATIFNLRNQIAEQEDTIRNQKIDIQQKTSQIELLKTQLQDAQKQVETLVAENNQLRGQVTMLTRKLEEIESETTKAKELSAAETELKKQLSEKEALIVNLNAQLETANHQIEELSKTLHQRDTDVERLAENMMELQQELSAKEEEVHRLQTQIDEIMMEIAEKEAVIKELTEANEKLNADKNKLEKTINEKSKEIETLKSKIEDTEKELETTKHTLEVLQKQGTMASDEKYEYELKIQKLKLKLENMFKLLKELEAFLNTDPKYRILYLLNDFQRPLMVEELVKILNVPIELVAKYIYELDYFGYIKKNLEGDRIFIQTTSKLVPPLYSEEEKTDIETVSD